MSGYFEDDVILGKAYDHRLMRRLLVFLRPHAKLVAWGMAFLAVGKICFLLQPYLIKKGIDCIQTGDERALWILLGWYLLLTAGRFVNESVNAYAVGLLGGRIVKDIRDRLFAHVQRLPLSFSDRNPVGRQVTRLTNDVDAVNNLFTSGIVVAFGDLLLLVGLAVAMFLMDWRLAASSLSVLPLLFWATIRFRKKAREAFRSVRVNLSRVNAYLAESINGSKLTLLFHRQDENRNRFARLNDEHQASNFHAVEVHATFVPLITLLTGVSITIAMGHGGWLTARGTLPVSTWVAFLFYLESFVEPVHDLSEKLTIFQSAMASSERIFQILDTPEESGLDAGVPALAPDAPLPARLEPSVEFDNVVFGYDENPVLKGMSFKISPGEHVAIVGSTGAGKTTVASLLCRFYDPQRGAIRIGGRDIGKLPRAFVRSQVALVLQEPVIFSGDVAFNIRLGEEQITEETLQDSAELVQADRFIRELPQGYRTVLPERGATLSTGQRQLLTYARALAFQRPILILDEATANIDPETEGIVQESLEVLMKGRTTILIAHRLATLKKVDRILVFDRGRVAESGTHAELLARKGLYANLYEMQFADSVGNGVL